MGENWSELQPELLETIAEKCLSSDIRSFVMISCACRSWNHASDSVKSSSRVLRQPMPWLLLPNDHNNNEDQDKRNMFDVQNNKFYTMSLPEISNRKCYGTGTEWILTTGLDRQIQLLNPLSRESLPLPSYLTFPHLHRHIELDLLELEAEQLDDNKDEYEEQEATNIERNGDDEPGFIHIPAPESPWDTNEWFRFHFVTRSFVLRLKHVGDKLLVIVIYDFGRLVTAAMPGDSKWTPIHGGVKNVSDVAYSQTLGLLLFVQHSGNVIYCDPSSPSFDVVDHVPPPSCFTSNDPDEDFNTLDEYDKLYLVESFGDILMVRRSFDENEKETFGFDVFKLDLLTKEWAELPGLGDVALFVGNGPATAVQTSDFRHSSCKPNAAYFNDDGYSYRLWGPKFDWRKGKLIDFVPGGRDMGVYTFDEEVEESIERFYPRDDYLSKYSVPIWFCPKLQFVYKIM